MKVIYIHNCVECPYLYNFNNGSLIIKDLCNQLNIKIEDTSKIHKDCKLETYRNNDRAFR